MAVRKTKLYKRDFFNNLKDYVGKPDISLMHGCHKVATIEVAINSNSKASANRFDVTVRYVGKTLKRIKANSFKADAGVERISNIINWNSVSYSDEKIFEFRTIEVQGTVVEPAQQKPAVIIRQEDKEDNRLSHFRYVPAGVPFWYQGNLYQRTNSDSHNALRIKDGCLCCLHFDVMVLKTLIEINVTGECP